MRRSLVLTDESAGHPFLATLAPHIRSGEPALKARPKLRLTRDDVRGFFAAYLGSLVAVAIFIA